MIINVIYFEPDHIPVLGIKRVNVCWLDLQRNVCRLNSFLYSAGNKG